MAGGRAPTPLFDLLSRRGAVTTRPAAPAPPRAERVSVRAARPAPADDTPAPEPQILRLPVNTLYIAVAAVLVLVLGAWIGGVKWGSSREAARHERELGELLGTRPSVAEPGVGQVLPPGVPDQGRADTGRQPTAGQAGVPTPPRVGGSVLVPGGFGADPREDGLNYLALAVLPQADATAAVAFLAQNQVGAFAVPVDGRGVEVNNPGPGSRYRLYALPGVTRDQLRSKQTIVTNLEARIAQVGQVWQREHRGASNFSKPGWVKYQ